MRLEAEIMRKPSDWNDTPSYDGESTVIKPGAYICKIIGMREKISKNGKPMVIFAFDIAEGEYKDYYINKLERDKRNNKDAKFKGTYYSFPLTNENKTNPYFKGIITAIERSNNFVLPDEFSSADVKGKLFGGLFGREEFEAGKWVTKLVTVRTVDKIRSGEYTLPEDKSLSNTNGSRTFGFSIDNDVDNEDLPF